MTKFRVAILVPEILDAIRKESMALLSRILPDKDRDPTMDEVHFHRTVDFMKAFWAGYPAMILMPDEFDVSVYPAKPRYTEQLFESNSFVEVYPGVQIPIVEYNGESVAVNDVVGFFYCESIDSPLDGDDSCLATELIEYIPSQNVDYILSGMEEELNIDTQLKLGMMIKAASNVSFTQSKLPIDKYVN